MHRILIVYDVSGRTKDGQEYGWAYWRRAVALRKYAPSDFSIEICPSAKVPWNRVSEFDLAFNLEYAIPNMYVEWVRNGGLKKPFLISFNSDSRRRRHYWPPVQKIAKSPNGFVVFNNVEAFDFYGRPQSTCCISNGVDTEVFKPAVPIEKREHRCLWMGSTGPRKQKGWQEIFQPIRGMLARHGFSHSFRPIDDINPSLVRPTGETVDYYNTGSYVLCASLSEGTPNYVTEAVACGCVAVSLPVGNILEWGVDRVNCVYVQRTIESFLAGLSIARNRREELSRAGVAKMQAEWSYGEPARRAAYYFALFRKLLAGETVEPFSYHEVNPETV